ncbi:MAG: leucine-rich repeat domain-containing protein [Prevotella sp.]|nr:leucine-rich repeat domain-containing protein [Prevotella sp.]
MKTRLIPILTKTATTLFMLLFMMTAQTAWAEKCQECGSSAYTITNTATCTQGGYYQYECDYCHCVWLGEATPALGHSVENNVCTRCGKYGYCGDYYHESEVTWEVTGDAPAYTLTISGTGAMKNYGSSHQPWAAFKDVITTANIGDGVTRIGGNAFYQFTALTSVTIASSVTTIGNAVFFECTNLTTVSGASGVTYVDSSAFDGTAWENNLPDGLTSVGHVAYRFVGDGTSVNLDAATTQIYEYCFQDSKITSIVIPASVERIGDYAFANSALQKMYVLRSGSNSTEITQLGNDAFFECRDDLVIVVPTAAYSTYSGHWYSYNSKLQRGYNITCNEGITATSYAPIVAQGETVTLSGTGTIPDGYAFAGYSVTKDGTNPAETVTVTEASGVYSFTMPASNVTVNATFIQVSGTCGTSGHESEVTWEVTDTDDDGRYDKLTIGGTGAMKNYSSYNQPWAGFKPDINTLVIGDGVTIIGTNAFNGCTSLATVTFAGTPQLTAIYGDAFYGCAALTTINIPASVTTLYGGVFQNCTNLATVSGGDGLTSIGTSAFYNTPWKANLNDNIPNNALFYLGHVAYRMKGDASNITLDEGTTQIYDDAFYGNSTLTTIIIPASVTSIGECAFGSCENLSKVYVLRTTPITTLGGNAFDSRPNLVIVAAAEGDYSGDDVWRNYNPQSGYTVTCGTGITFTTTYNGPLVEQDEEVTLSGTGEAPAGCTTPFIGYSVIDRWGDPVDMQTENTFLMPCDVTVSAVWTTIPWAGSGDSADDPYIIEYPSQLDLLATNVNDGESYSGKYFVLANDITYTHTTDWNANSEENNYTAIGGVFNSSIHPFNGTFDGKGHTVSGIRIYKWGKTDAESYQGLFGYVGNNGTVKNVTVADACISGYEEVGGVVGQIEYGGKVENCHATATVALHAVMTKTSGFGGIAGITYNATISGCSSAVTLTSKTGCYYFGAIVGCANMGTLRNNLAIGTAIPALKYNTNYEASGAIVGHNGEATLEHNYYSGCTVGDATSGIGSGYHINGSNDRHDVTDNDGAVPAIILSETQTSMPTLNAGDKVAFRREFKENVASTVCLPFAIDATQAAAAGKFYTFVGVDKTDPNDWEVIMQEADPTADPPVAGNKASTLSANTPYLFKPAATGPVLFHGTAPATTEAGNAIKEGWTFRGTYDRIDWLTDPQTVYGFAATNATTISPGTFFRVKGGSNSYILPFRAYLDAANCSSPAPRRTSATEMPAQMKVRLIAADGGTTGVREVNVVKEVNGDNDNSWHTLDGRKLDKQPTQKGLYIVNGKKVVIK